MVRIRSFCLLLRIITNKLSCRLEFCFFQFTSIITEVMIPKATVFTRKAFYERVLIILEEEVVLSVEDSGKGTGAATLLYLVSCEIVIGVVCWG